MDVVWPIGPTFSSATEDLGENIVTMCGNFFTTHTHTVSEKAINLIMRVPRFWQGQFLNGRSIFRVVYASLCLFIRI